VEQPATPVLSRGEALYQQHCAGCHGAKGDGQGMAAVFLYPRPRDFRAGKFRLVSTNNGVATPSDLEAVLVRGMPGSSMPPWGHLPEADRKLLAELVMKMRYEGAREEFIRQLKEQGEEEIDMQEVEDVAQQLTTPGQVPAAPEFGQADPQAIARGKAIYLKQGCHSCHGNEGRGDGQQKMVDFEGTPTRPRDLTLGIYKGGHDPLSVYYRIALGMPGSPMPSSAAALPVEAMVDLTHFIRSLSDEPTRQATVLRREKIFVRRVPELPSGDDRQWLDSSSWSAAEVVRLRLTPLWWRDLPDPYLQVQALHDGTTLALRLSWHDTVANYSPHSSEQFEDLAAVQWYLGPKEPFLGMGAAAGQVDVWQWRAGWNQPVSYADSLLDDYPFEMPVYDDILGGKKEGVPDFLTARAAGNLITNADRTASAASLGAGGAGSLTFRPNVSQVVTARSQWNEGRWTVVLLRPLRVPPDDGLPLAAGQSCSVAFAIWDGAAHDRAGQKLISIWQDLKLE
jgi:mono/diheme cytochrome c family protein